MDWLDLIWPKKCVNCGRLGRYVCSACEVGLWEAEQVCPVCNQPSFYGQTHPRCRQASSLDGLTCMWTYAGVARRIITKAQTKYFDVLRELLITNHQLVSRPELSHLVRFLLQRPTVVAIPVLPSSFRSDHIKIAANL
ncbi:MAG: double zinc ribbon domain-containing protein, partial [bacterium]|nr:double zinc ribbon domain-containing protein [bacterium]